MCGAAAKFLSSPVLHIRAQVRDWVDDIVSSWNFNKVIPAHMIAPVRTSPAEFKRAFTFAYEGVEEEEEQAAPAAGPVGFLSSLFGGAQRASTAKVSDAPPCQCHASHILCALQRISLNAHRSECSLARTLLSNLAAPAMDAADDAASGVPRC